MPKDYLRIKMHSILRILQVTLIITQTPSAWSSNTTKSVTSVQSTSVAGITSASSSIHVVTSLSKTSNHSSDSPQTRAPSYSALVTTSAKLPITTAVSAVKAVTSVLSALSPSQEHSGITKSSTSSATGNATETKSQVNSVHVTASTGATATSNDVPNVSTKPTISTNSSLTTSGRGSIAITTAELTATRSSSILQILTTSPAGNYQ